MVSLFSGDSPPPFLMKHAHVRIALAYLVIGVTWIFTTDSILKDVAKDVEWLSIFQMFKGWLFVGLSTLLIYWIGRQAYRGHQAWLDERQRIFRSTVKGSYHLVLNHLNNMQLVFAEAEETGKLDSDMIADAKRSAESVRKGMIRLGQVRDVTEKAIDLAVYEDDEGSGWPLLVESDAKQEEE